MSAGGGVSVIALLLRVVFVTGRVARAFEGNVVGSMEYEGVGIGGSLLILVMLLTMGAGVAGDSVYFPSRSKDAEGQESEGPSSVVLVLVDIFATVVVGAVVVGLPLALVTVFVTVLFDSTTPPIARNGVANAPCWCSGIRTAAATAARTVAAGAEGEAISTLLKWAI